MAGPADTLISSTSRPLRLHRRLDLTVVRHRYQGRPYWVIKEPLGLRYFRFQEEEYAVLQMLDGKSSLDDLKERFNERFQPQQIEHRELQQFVGTLHRSGLVTSDRTGQGVQLHTRGKKQKWKKRMAGLANVLALRTRGVDPDRLFDRILPFTSWFFARTTVILVAMLALGALSLVLAQWSVFVSRLPSFHQFFGPHNWLLLGVVLGVTKIFHEFGHGLSCKRYGGECHELGFMLLVLTPCLYCNVSDSWLLSSKWKRAAIGAGGMYVEVAIASTATFLWWFSPPGPLNQLYLQLMFVCSVSTLLFNGNPLLRFDGYYILADLIEIPNLRQKASEILKRLFQKWCLGIPVQSNPFLPKRNQWLFALYTVAAVVYRWVVLFSILMFLNKMFEPYGLEVVGKLIALTSVVGLIGMPLWQVYRFLSIPGRVDQVKPRNATISLAILAALAAFIVFAPLPAHVRCETHLAPRDATNIFVAVDGILEEAMVQPGDTVEANQEVLRTISPALELQIAEVQKEREILVARHELLLRQSLSDEQRSLDLLHVQESLQGVQTQLDELRSRRERLIVRASRAGVIFPPPPANQLPALDQIELPTRTSSLFDRASQGAPLRAGESIVCTIGTPGDFEAILMVPEKNIEFIEPGQTVQIRLDAYPSMTITGEVVEVGNDPIYLAADGSRLPEDAIATHGPQAIAEVAYLISASITDADPQWRSGLTGKAKVRIESLTVAARVYRFLAQSFRFN